MGVAILMFAYANPVKVMAALLVLALLYTNPVPAFTTLCVFAFLYFQYFDKR